MPSRSTHAGDQPSSDANLPRPHCSWLAPTAVTSANTATAAPLVLVLLRCPSAATIRKGCNIEPADQPAIVTGVEDVNQQMNCAHQVGRPLH